VWWERGFGGGGGGGGGRRQRTTPGQIVTVPLLCPVLHEVHSVGDINKDIGEIMRKRISLCDVVESEA